MTSRRALFVVNPAAGAGRGRSRWQSFQRDLQREPGLQITPWITGRPGEARDVARARAGEFDIIFAVGGDGTAFEVASGILASENSQCALGVVPTGTGNDIGAALGISAPAEARAAFLYGSIRTLDVIRIECRLGQEPVTRHALLFAGVGIGSECLKRTTPGVKRLFGERLAYPIGLLRAIWSYSAPRLRVDLDGQAMEGPFLFVCANNSECVGGGMRLAPGALMDDGQLNISLIEALGRWAALCQVRRVCQGRHIHHPQVRYLSGKRLSVEAEGPLEVAADGELVGQTPAVFEVLPRALPVLALGG